MFISLQPDVRLRWDFRSKCSILNGQVICIEKWKLNITDKWLIPLDRVYKCNYLWALHCLTAIADICLYHICTHPDSPWLATQVSYISLNVKRVKWLLFKRVESVKTTLIEWKSPSKRVKIIPKEWISLLGGAHRKTARKERAVPQRASPKKWFSLSFGAIFTRFGMIFTLFEGDFSLD